MRSKICMAARAIFPNLLIFALASAIASRPSQAQTFTVLHTFKGVTVDGEAPFGRLVRDSTGNLYGTTSEGGSGKCGKHGCGTAFMLNKRGKQVGLYSFSGKNGLYPFAGLLRDSSGNLYGTTEQGGADCYHMGFSGCGTVFKLSKTGKETLLYSFTGAPDGFFPNSGLVEDSSGNIYGTTSEGGVYGAGTLFKVDGSGEETVLYSFTGSADGCTPTGLIMDGSGNLYGAAAEGGSTFCNSGYGTVYEFDTAGNLIVLHTFNSADGAHPGISILDAAGNIFGTTSGGGIGCGTGCGTIFQLSPQGGGNWSETILYEFCSLANCSDGEEPGPLVMDAVGNLYGSTYFGGADRNCNGDGCGVVFKLDLTGSETVLHSFTGGADGANPAAGLVMDSFGDLYGTAEGGGDATCSPPDGCGTVFELTP